jgi:hypothetical protein
VECVPDYKVLVLLYEIDIAISYFFRYCYHYFYHHYCYYLPRCVKDGEIPVFVSEPFWKKTEQER